MNWYGVCFVFYVPSPLIFIVCVYLLGLHVCLCITITCMAASTEVRRPSYNWNYWLLLAPKVSTTYPSGLMFDSTFDGLFTACTSRPFFLPRPSSALALAHTRLLNKPLCPYSSVCAWSKSYSHSLPYPRLFQRKEFIPASSLPKTQPILGFQEKEYINKSGYCIPTLWTLES